MYNTPYCIVQDLYCSIECVRVLPAACSLSAKQVQAHGLGKECSARFRPAEAGDGQAFSLWQPQCPMGIQQTPVCRNDCITSSHQPWSSLGASLASQKIAAKSHQLKAILIHIEPPQK